MSWDVSNLFCHDLLTRPQPEIGKILVTGATAYIGGRLVPELLARGYDVRVMVRTASPEHEERWPNAEIVVADALKLDGLKEALAGIHTAYYLIHSNLLKTEKLQLADIRAASNFRKAAEQRGLKRIIYVGALGDSEFSMSPHHRSRIHVAQALKGANVSTTVLRVAPIIGSGSRSYELLTHLVRKSPILIAPRWARNKCQPISIRDLIKILVGVLEIDETKGKSFDIGGKEILTHEMMLRILANILGKKRLFVKSPLSNVGFYAYAASLITPVPALIVRTLLEARQNEAVCRNNDIRRVLSLQPATFKEAILRAMTREELDQVHTRWSDAYPPAHELAIKLHELQAPPHYATSYSLLSEKSASSLFRSICKIGGSEGWFGSNWMWKLRGTFDRMVMGVGISRGRRRSSNLRINDVIDFWRVEALKNDHLLLLRAEMKLPGMAWLEFRIDRETDRSRLSVQAYYEPRRFFGKIYWYVFLPFHHFIFNDIIKQIELRS